MGLGALIGAYQEDDSGALRALLPLAGRTLLEYQIRCAWAAGAAPIIVVVERVPQALQDIFARLRIDGIGVFPVSDVQDAVSRFEPGWMILLIGDGVAAPAGLVADLASEAEPTIATVPDDDDHAAFERIDAEARWAGLALIDGELLGSTAKMLGDWDLQSTLLRRAIQEGARRMASGQDSGAVVLVEQSKDLNDFQQRLIANSRAARNDWPSRYLLPPVEEVAVHKLMESQVRPQWLVWTALVLIGAAAVAFLNGFLLTGLVLALLSTPLDLIASRLANLRLRPLPLKMPSRRALWPASGIAALALGWWQTRHGGHDWTPFIAAVAAIAFAQAARIECSIFPANIEPWLLNRRGAIFLALPFALFGAWTAYLVALWIYAMASFFIVQRVRHGVSELTRS